MIYRYDILARDGLYEGWARDADEMKEKFKAQRPGEPEPFLFLSGGAPKRLDYRAYERAQDEGLSDSQIRVVDEYLASRQPEPSSVARLWQSTEDLHKRFFGNELPEFDSQWRCFFEELAEFTNAVTLPIDLADGDELREAGDVIVTIMGLLRLRGFSLVELENVFEHVAEKNDAKTHETHFVNEKGKIARRQS